MDKQMKIVEIREVLGMSQIEFANYIGLSRRTIEEWEAGRRQPKSYVMDMIITKVRYDLIKKGVNDVYKKIY